MPNFIDISGNRFGLLVAIRPLSRPTNSGTLKWVCNCDCGSQADIDGASLRSGRTKSCGCRQGAKRKYQGHQSVRGDEAYWARIISRFQQSANQNGHIAIKSTHSELKDRYDNHNKRCDLCDTKEVDLNKNLCVDHCHYTGRVRGFLCVSCNSVLKQSYEIDLFQKIISYLEK